MTIRLFLLLFTISLTACTISQNTPTYKANETVSMDTFLQDAITEGLKRDKITKELASEIAAIDKFFIGKCNICKNVLKAFKEHESFSQESEMIGQASTLKEVKQEGPKGKAAMQKVVTSYLEYHLENSGLTPVQKKTIEETLVKEAKKGEMLITTYTFCPSCKGTKGACIPK